MKSRLFLLSLVISLLSQPCFAAEMRTLDIKFSFDAAAVAGKTLASFKLYQDSNLVCETDVPATGGITCVVSPSTQTNEYQLTAYFPTTDGTHIFELAAHYTDGSDSPKSPDFSFTIAPTGTVGTPPPASTGGYLVSYSWETTAVDSTISGYRMYMNDTALCETSDPQATSLSCYTDLINAVMNFAVVSFNSSNTESAKSNFLTLDPADFPEIFQKKALTFNWEYTDSASNAGGFQVFHNGALLCQTSDTAARSLGCTIGTLQPENTFTLAAVDSTGVLTAFSNVIVYSSASTTTPPTTTELKAAISASTTSGPAPLSISFSAASSTGSISGYTWDFGDGDVGTGSTVSHTFSTAGNYTTTLAVSDTTGNTSSAAIAITATQTTSQPVPPVAVISSSTAAGEAPLSVSFNGSGSTATNATIVSYNWDFGDGTQATGVTAGHIFTIAGTFNTQLLVADSGGLTDTETTPVVVSPSTVVNQKPVAAFSATPTQGPSPLAVNFDASTSTDADGSVASYAWNFGDGSNGQGKTIQHIYTNAASYTASLQVTDNLGAASQSVSKAITADVAPPVVTLNYEIGELSLTSDWVKVNFANTFNNPMVFVSPASYNDKEATTIRIRNVTKLGFEVRLQEWDYLDGKHLSETVNFLVLEQGQTPLPNGGMLEVGVFTGSTSRAKTITYKQPFTAPPIVLTNVISLNDSKAVVGRLSNATAKGFSYIMQQQEATKGKHADESVAYLAWSKGSGDVDNIHYSASIPTAAVTSSLTTVPLSESFTATPFFFTDMQTMNDTDPATLRIQKLSNSNVTLFVQEEQSKDSEVDHQAEKIGYLSISAQQ